MGGRRADALVLETMVAGTDVGQTWSFSAGTAYGFTETLAPGQIYRYRFATEEIKGPIQEIVNGCGWAYKGVVFGKP
jgi:hypothetical protein